MNALVALLLLAGPLVTEPRYANPLPYPLLPPQLEDRLVYYRSFDAPGGRAEVDQLSAKVARDAAVGDGGFVGAAGKSVLRLQSPGFTPSGPLTVACWWRLATAPARNAGYGLCSLNGRGYVSLFGRGGPWCGLTDTGAVLQCWSFSGIKNVNCIYDTAVRTRLDLTAWHHTALTFASGTTVRVYTDGAPTVSVLLEGRAIAADDGLANLELGGDGTWLDEVLVLQRTLGEGELADYVAGCRAVRELSTTGAPTK